MMTVIVGLGLIFLTIAGFCCLPTGRKDTGKSSSKEIRSGSIKSSEDRKSKNSERPKAQSPRIDVPLKVDSERSLSKAPSSTEESIVVPNEVKNPKYLLKKAYIKINR